MKLGFTKIAILLIFSSFLLASNCHKEKKPEVTIRDRKEQYLENEKDSILNFIKTHTYSIDEDQNFHFDTLTDPSVQRSIYDDARVLQIADTTVDDLVYDVYYLDLARGTGDSITTCDLVLVGACIYGFDGSTYMVHNRLYPLWTSVYKPMVGNLPFYALHEFLPLYKGGGYTANPDGTVDFYGYGNMVLFVPSGLAQFADAVSVTDTKYLPSYTPFIAQIKTFYVNTDLDEDHVPNVLEDLNGDGDPTNDNTDDPDGKDPGNKPNYLDPDDDGDHLKTIYEDTNGNGDPTDDDDDGDGIPNYLDKDTH